MVKTRALSLGKSRSWPEPWVALGASMSRGLDIYLSQYARSQDAIFLGEREAVRRSIFI